MRTTRGRAIAGSVVATLLALAPLRAAPGEPPSPKDVPAADRELQSRIDAAIDRGVARLRATQRANGSWASAFGSAGATGLALYTMLCSGVAKDDPDVLRAAKYLDGIAVEKGTTMDVMADRTPAARMTYDHALLVLALVAHGSDAHRKAIRRSVDLLVHEQKPSGQWAYTVSMGGPLDAGDNSNTQFALLALRHAALDGFPVPSTVWQRSYRHFERTAGKDGGWGYGCPNTMEGSYGSMTAVGVASLVICKAMLLGESKAPTFAYRDLPEVSRGLTWLLVRFNVDRNPEVAKVTGPAGPPGAPGGPGMPANPGRFGVDPQTFHFYWLYALERVGMLLGMRRLGALEWYVEGARWLVEHQEADGGWTNAAASRDAPEPPLAATCFALLFLRRATRPVVLTPSTDR